MTKQHSKKDIKMNQANEPMGIVDEAKFRSSKTLRIGSSDRTLERGQNELQQSSVNPMHLISDGFSAANSP